MCGMLVPFATPDDYFLCRECSIHKTARRLARLKGNDDVCVCVCEVCVCSGVGEISVRGAGAVGTE